MTVKNGFSAKSKVFLESKKEIALFAVNLFHLERGKLRFSKQIQILYFRCLKIEIENETYFAELFSYARQRSLFTILFQFNFRINY